jgi:RecA/RadA recombinase
MHSQNTAAIEILMDAIQQKWGADALRPLHELKHHEPASLCTGIADLDAATGGIPLHRLTSLLGKPTSGTTTMAYLLMAQAQQSQLVTIYLDAPHSFDPEYALYRGLDMDLVLLIRPETWEHALEMLRDMVGIAVAGFVVFDTFSPDIRSSEKQNSFSATLERVAALLPHSTWTLLTMAPPDLPVSVDSSASLRLSFERLYWLYEEDVLNGYQTKITTLKNKSGPIPQPIIVNFTIRGAKR